MAYEAIVGCHAMSTFQEIRDRALGKAKYAWELPSSELPERWRRFALAASGATLPGARSRPAANGGAAG